MRRPVLLATCVLLVGGCAAVPATVAADEENVTVYRVADHVAADFDSASDIRVGIDGGTVETTDRGYHDATELLTGDIAVFAVDSRRLVEDVRVRSDDPTEGFMDVVDHEASFTVGMVNPHVDPVDEAPKFVLTGDNTRAYVGNETVYVLVDTGSVETEPLDASGEPDGRPGERETYAMGFTYGTDDADELHFYDGPKLEFVERSVVLDADTAALASGTVNVTGRTTFPPGSPLRLRVELPNATRSESVRIRGGTFAGSVDLSAVPAGTDYELEVHHGARTYDSLEGFLKKETAGTPSSDTETPLVSPNDRPNEQSAPGVIATLIALLALASLVGRR